MPHKSGKRGYKGTPGHPGKHLMDGQIMADKDMPMKPAKKGGKKKGK